MSSIDSELPRVPDGIFGPGEGPMLDTSSADAAATELITRHTYAAVAAMIAIPVPGVDIAATTAVFVRMTMEIARVYGYEISKADAARLASHLFKSVVLTTVVWFGSATLAASVLKFIPGAGTLVAYLVDAVIAAFGAKRVTAALGASVALYFKSGREAAPRTILEHVKNVAKDPELVSAVLHTFRGKAKGK